MHRPESYPDLFCFEFTRKTPGLEEEIESARPRTPPSTGRLSTRDAVIAQMGRSFFTPERGASLSDSAFLETPPPASVKRKKRPRAQAVSDASTTPPSSLAASHGSENKGLSPVASPIHSIEGPFIDAAHLGIGEDLENEFFDTCATEGKEGALRFLRTRLPTQNAQKTFLCSIYMESPDEDTDRRLTEIWNELFGSPPTPPSMHPESPAHLPSAPHRE